MDLSVVIMKKSPKYRQKDYKEQLERKYSENKTIFLMEFKGNKIKKRWIKNEIKPKQ